MKDKNNAVKIILCLFPASILFLFQLILSSVLPPIIRTVVSMWGGNPTWIFYENGGIAYFFFFELVCMSAVLIWYSLAYGKKKKKPDQRGFFQISNLFDVLLTGLGMYLIVAVYLDAVSLLLPVQMVKYSEMIESSGLAGLTVLSTITTVCVAPVFEELLFRGLMLRAAEDVKLPFWEANLIQALVFGMFHMDLIQGIYAFFLGLVLGYFYKSYQVMAAPILLHGMFNLFGTYLAGAVSKVPGGFIFGNLILLAAGSILLILAEVFKRKRGIN